MTQSPARRAGHPLDADLEAYVQRMERLSLRVVLNVIGIAGALLGIDAYFKGGPPSLVGWLAVLVVAGVALPLNKILRVLAQGQRLWALGEQERRAGLPDETPPRQRTGRQGSLSEGRSRARLTPVPQDEPREVSKT